MTENPIETERNVIICSFFDVLLVSDNIVAKNLTLLISSSVKGIRRQKVTKFLASDEFPPTKIYNSTFNAQKSRTNCVKYRQNT